MRNLVTERDMASDDHLVNCLQFIATFLETPASATSLLAGLPLEDKKLSPHLVPRAAQQVGLDVRVTKRPLKAVLIDSLPLLLIYDARPPVVIFAVERDRIRYYDPTTQANVETVRALHQFEGYTNAVSFHRNYSTNDKDGPSRSDVIKEHWFLNVISGYWRNYLAIFLAAATINAVALLTPLYIMNVYDRVLPHNATATLAILSVGLFIAFIFDFILKSARAAVIDYTGRRFNIEFSTAIFDRILNARLANKYASTGSYVRCMQQYEHLSEFFNSNTISFFTDVLFVIVFFYIIYFVGGSVVYIPVIGLCAVLMIGAIVHFLLARNITSADAVNASRSALLVETVGAVQTLKNLRAEGTMLKRWEQTVHSLTDSQRRARSLSSFALNLTQLTQQLVTIGVVVSSVYLFMDGSLTMGAIVALVILSSRAVAPFSQVVGTLMRARYAVTAYRLIDDLMRQPDERQTNRAANRIVAKGALELRGVTFAYPGEKQAVLTDLSLKVDPGERIGIIGRIGSGKTTLGRLLCGLYRVSEGMILVDGVDIEQYHPHELRQSVFYVGQDTDIFRGTVRENILLAAPNATDERLLAAAEQSGVDDFVSVHPSGFDMDAGERGGKLSNGQRQAIALARALLVRPKVLFLDEPSSFLDIATEKKLIENLKLSLQSKQTLIVATHRHSMLDLVDRLIVLDAGRLVADGPRDVVLAKLVAAQESRTKVKAARPARVINAPQGGFA